MHHNGTPWGCGPQLDSLYFRLCDLSLAWGIVLEALAAAGVVFCIVLFLALLAIVPFTPDKNRRRSVPLGVAFLVCTAGLFGLTFAFIVGKDFATCASRRFLFGVLFAGCFSCLLMQSVRINVLARRDGSGPPAWALCLGALGLWLVEVVINTEWLIITIVRQPGNANAIGNANANTITNANANANTNADTITNANANVNVNATAMATSCNIANEDFVMALIYVMALLLALLWSSLAVMAVKRSQWKKDGAFILLAALASVGIWVAWIVMYVYGNRRHGGGPSWDDPTLAIALVANAWAFLVLYTIPEICSLSGAETPRLGEEVYQNPEHGVGYETILKEQSKHNMFLENKAFSLDEPNAASQPVSPYSGYTGQLRGSVYQPTELAIISKAVGSRPPDVSYDLIIPRASATSGNSGRSTPSTHPESLNAPHSNGSNGNGLQRMSQW